MGLKHQAVSARKWRAAIRQVERHFPADLPTLLFLTDPKRVPDPIAVVRTLPRGAGIIYRHFGAKDRRNMAQTLRNACKARQIRLLIAGDPDLATTVGADGVHWPEARLQDARKWRGCFSVQTASAHSQDAITRASKAGMDAVLYSTVFSSNSASASRPLGVFRFKIAATRTSLPIYALGGVNHMNAQRVANVSGLAAIEGLLPS